MSSETRPSALTSAEQDFLCATIPPYASRLGREEESDAVPTERREELDRTISMRASPPSVRCGARTFRLAASDEFVDFVDGFGLSADGRLGLLSGGWQAAPLMGGGGVCYFERNEGGWTLLGCVGTWVS